MNLCRLVEAKIKWEGLYMREIPALKVQQWLPEWDSVKFDDSSMRREPPHKFYLFSISARELRALSGIQRRTAQDRPIGYVETGIQRRHDEQRSSEILDYMRWGFPHAVFSPQNRMKFDHLDSKMPGWLPTAIVVNILSPEFSDVRKGQRVADGDHIQVRDGDGPYATICLPELFEHSTWLPKELPPIEVIDGQHRLWAVGESNEFEDYELPVVAFNGLDLSWQAYLFYTINIRPVKINASLAFDLYPLLRTEKWLIQADGPLVYRETRAQEIVQALYSHEDSPWFHRINMLGEPGQRMVRQSAWIRSLLATYVKPLARQDTAIGGLFGSIGHNQNQPLDWDSAQQVAFLMYLGMTLRKLVASNTQEWANRIREHEVGWRNEDLENDPAFYGRYSLLNTDQGIRGLLAITNDISFESINELELWNWSTGEFGRADNLKAITQAVQSLANHNMATFMKELMAELATFDWRTSSTPGLTDQERTVKLGFRGSSGYREIRRRLLLHVAGGSSHASKYANIILAKLGFERG